jgi:hypothetical protein
MARDAVIEKTFVTVDDAMQGLWGLQSYIRAAVSVADRNQVERRLPQGAFKLTHEWERYYDPGQLASEMGKVGEHVMSRMCLLNLVALFEAAVKQFHRRLRDCGHARDLKKSGYKALLKWAFERVRNNALASAPAIGRLPGTCGDVDNARRLRNIIVHNNARYEEFYRTDAIIDGWVEVKHEAGFEDAIIHKRALLLAPDRFEAFSWSHVELLHILHNTIQRDFFGHDAGFNYRDEGKAIEWRRVLSG